MQEAFNETHAKATREVDLKFVTVAGVKFNYIFTDEAIFTDGDCIEERQLPFEKYLGKDYLYAQGRYGIKHLDKQLIHRKYELYAKPDTVYSYRNGASSKWVVVELKSGAIKPSDSIVDVRDRHKDFLQLIIEAWVARDRLLPKKPGVLAALRYRNALFWSDNIMPARELINFYAPLILLSREHNLKIKNASVGATELAQLIATLEPGMQTPNLSEELLKEKGHLFELINFYGKDTRKIREFLTKSKPDIG